MQDANIDNGSLCRIFEFIRIDSDAFGLIRMDSDEIRCSDRFRLIRIYKDGFRWFMMESNVQMDDSDGLRPDRPNTYVISIQTQIKKMGLTEVGRGVG